MGKTISPPSKSNISPNKKQKNGTQQIYNNGNTPKVEVQVPSEPVKSEDQKSLLVAYLLWAFGGFFGLHHIYLHRDAHAFVHWCTFAGYFGIGWIVDAFKLPEMVRDCNEDPAFVKQFIEKLKYNRQPPFSTYRFLGEICVAFLFGQVAMIAIPESPVYGIDFSFIHWIIPLGIALGAYKRLKPRFYFYLSSFSGQSFNCIFYFCG